MMNKQLIDRKGPSWIFSWILIALDHSVNRWFPWILWVDLEDECMLTGTVTEAAAWVNIVNSDAWTFIHCAICPTNNVSLKHR